MSVMGGKRTLGRADAVNVFRGALTYGADMRCLVLGLLLVCSACSASNKGMISITMGEARYQVPEAHILSMSREPHQFLRIKPPEGAFELVYDSRTASQSDQFAWPVIFSLNEDRAPDIQRHVIGDLTVVCRQAVHPKGGCGMKLRHDGVDWAVLFPLARQNEASVIRERALKTLNAYRA